MPVVEKIKTTKKYRASCTIKDVFDIYGVGYELSFYGKDSDWRIYYYAEYENLRQEISQYPEEKQFRRQIVGSYIEAIYCAVLQFIKWYNTTNQ